MIRALFSFVVTLGLIGAAALWAVRNVEPQDLVRAAETPVSRTVALVAAELGDELAAALEPAARAAVERAAPPAAAQAAPSVVEAEAPVAEAEPSEPELEAALPRADTAPDGATAGGSGGSGEALAESAVLLRRMLGLYERTLGPQ